MAQIVLYMSSVSGSLKIKKQQQHIQSILESKRIAFDQIDVAADDKAKTFMQNASGKAVVPQIFVDGQYRGDYDDFHAATEDGALESFLGLTV